MIRRGATMECGSQRREGNWSPIARRWFHRRSATRLFGVIADRGLKPTATFSGRSATKAKNQKSPEGSGVRISEIAVASLRSGERAGGNFCNSHTPCSHSSCRWAIRSVAKVGSELPSFDSDAVNLLEVRVASDQWQVVLVRDGGDPKIIFWNWLTDPRTLILQPTVDLSRCVVAGKNRGLVQACQQRLHFRHFLGGMLSVVSTVKQFANHGRRNEDAVGCGECSLDSRVLAERGDHDVRVEQHAIRHETPPVRSLLQSPFPWRRAS